MRDKKIAPRLTAVLKGVFGCVFAPFTGGSFLRDNFGILQLVGTFRFTKEKLLLCFHNEIGFVSLVFVVLNLKLVSGRLEPFQHLAVVFQNHGNEVDPVLRPKMIKLKLGCGAWWDW